MSDAGWPGTNEAVVDRGGPSMSEPASPVLASDAPVLQTTPKLAPAELPKAQGAEGSQTVERQKKRDRESALGSGAVTPNSPEDAKGFSLTPVAKKGRVQTVSSSPRQPRDLIKDDASRADVEEAEASPSPPETPPGQLSVSPSSRGALPPVTAPETGRVANIRQKVQRMSTGADDESADVDTASHASYQPLDQDKTPLSAARDEGDPLPVDTGTVVVVDPEDDDMRSTRGPTPVSDVDAASGSTVESDILHTAPLASSSPSKPVSSFASFSKSASPFAAVPSSSRPSFGGPKLSGAPFSKVLPLSKPNVQALANAMGGELAPPSPASSIRAEVGSVAPISRQSSFSGSARAESQPPESSKSAQPPVAASIEQAKEPPEELEELKETVETIPATSSEAQSPPAPSVDAPSDAPGPAAALSASSFAARFAGSTSAFGKAKPSSSAGGSAFGSFSSSTTSPFGSVRKSPYPPGGRKSSQESASPDKEKADRSFGELLKQEGEVKSETDVNGDDVVPKMLFKEQEGTHELFLRRANRADEVCVVVTGEEDEENLYSVRGKLYVMESGSWRERGLGQLRLNAKFGGGHPRLVMRADATHRLLLNAALFPGFQIKASDRQIQFGTVEDGAFTSWALKVSNAQVSTAAVAAVQSALDSLTPSGEKDAPV